MNFIMNALLVVMLSLALIGQPSMAQDQQAKRQIYDQQTEEYLGIRAVGKLMSTKWKVEVDFGQAFEWSVKNKDLMRDASGKTIAFNSPIDAMNFLNSQGWILVTAAADETSFYAVMKREK